MRFKDITFNKKKKDKVNNKIAWLIQCNVRSVWIFECIALFDETTSYYTVTAVMFSTTQHLCTKSKGGWMLLGAEKSDLLLYTLFSKEWSVQAMVVAKIFDVRTKGSEG